MRYDIEGLFADFVRTNGLDVRLSHKLPAGYEDAFGTFDPVAKTLYMDGAFLAQAAEHEALYYLYHELRHAVQYQRPERVDEAVRESARYAIGYDGTCCRLDGDRWSKCVLEGDRGYFTRAYQSQPSELDANRFALERASALLPEQAGLVEGLAELWLPEDPMDPAELAALYRRIDGAIEEQGGAKRYRLVIFDLDGTILDTLEDLAASVNHALAACGYPTRTVDEVRRFVGNGVRKLVQRAVPAGTGEAEMEKVFAAFKEHYAVHSMDATRPYPYITFLLKGLKLKGMRLAVVSSKLDGAVGPLCEHFFPGLFDVTVGERPGVRKKPAPNAVEAVLKALDISREKAVYIGDSEVDIATAKNAGMDEIAVTWGFRDGAFLRQQGAKRLVDSPGELYDILTEG